MRVQSLGDKQAAMRKRIQKPIKGPTPRKYPNCELCGKDLTGMARQSKKCGICRGWNHAQIRNWKEQKAANALSKRAGDIFRKYKITIGEFQALLIKFNYSCGICGMFGGQGGAKLAVDHNHKTGQIRGLLCRACNTGLGFFRDNETFLANGIEYLDNARMEWFKESDTLFA